MTLPNERTRAVIRARRLLCQMIAPGGLGSPREVREIREAARDILRHYPGVVEVSAAGDAAPHLFDSREAWRAAADE
jgi:hypothetical protein